MSLLAIILLILLGLLLLIVEFLLVPGITIAGIAGMILLGGSVYFSYHFLGSTTGNIVLVSTALVVVITLYYALKSRTWKLFMLNTNIEGNTNTLEENSIKPGDTGKTVTRLNPAGKAMINGLMVEASSTGTYINQQTEIEVIKVVGSKVIVKLKN